MSLSDSIIVKVPATTANLGAGFDCIGTALNLYNQFEFTLTDDKTTFTVEGEGANNISLTEDNLLYQSFSHFYTRLGLTIPSVAVKIKINVPLARGLGSSATAIIAGLVAGNYFQNQPLTNHQLLDSAIALEGHPDNVAPALLGGCILSVGEKDNWQFISLPCHEEIKFVVAIPDFELSTESARAVLPKHLSYSDAVYNIAHLGLLIKALETANPQWLKEALNDKLHQPYRKDLIKGYDQLQKAVIDNGGYGMVISGAGPTLLALTSPNYQQKITDIMTETWLNLGVKPVVKCLDLDYEGSTIA